MTLSAKNAQELKRTPRRQKKAIEAPFDLLVFRPHWSCKSLPGWKNN
jgi:hypothetical protein